MSNKINFAIYDSDGEPLVSTGGKVLKWNNKYYACLQYCQLTKQSHGFIRANLDKMAHKSEEFMRVNFKCTFVDI